MTGTESYFKIIMFDFFAFITADLIAFMFILAGAFVKDDFLLVILMTGLPVTALLVLIYNNNWKNGFSDIGIVNMGHYKYNRFKGLYAALIFQAPSLIWLLFSVMLKTQGLRSSFKLAHWYMASLYKIMPNYFSLAAFFIIAVIIFVSSAGYVFGYNDISLFKNLAYKKSK